MMKLIKKFLEVKNLLSICIVFSILTTISFLSPINGSPIFKLYIPLDKLIHIIIYLLLSFLWISYFYKANNYNKVFLPIILVIILCFFYGIIIEMIQELFIPLREADIFDVLANTIGTILGTLLFWNVKNRIKS